MPIDFNLIQSLKPNNEIASISNLLGAFAENRARRQQAAEAAAFQQKQFEAQQANIAADNARADAQMKLQEREHEDALGAAKAKQQREEQQGAYKALPDVMAMAGDRPQAAQAMAAGAGIQMQQQPRDMIDETTDVLDNRVTAPRYSFAVPHSPNVLEYDTGEARRAQKAGLERNVEDTRAAFAPLSKMPHSSRVAPVAEALALSGGKPEDAVKGAIASAQFGETQEGLDKRNAINAGRMAATHADTQGAQERRGNQMSLRGLNGEIKAWKHDNGIPKLAEAYGEAGKALSLAKSGNGPAQAAAVEGFIKSARGGAVTAAAQGFMTAHMGGTLDMLEQKLQMAKDGKFSPELMAQLQQGLTAAREALKEEVEAKRKGFVADYYNGSYDDMKVNVDNAYAGMFEPFGYKTERQAGATGISAKGSNFTGKGAAPTQAGGIPAGGRPGTLNGKRGYALGGKFYPLEGSGE